LTATATATAPTLRKIDDGVSAEFLRVATEDDGFARAVTEDPRALAHDWPNARMRTIARLAIIVTEAPWELSRQHLTAAPGAWVTL
jgi:hypothetical protein